MTSPPDQVRSLAHFHLGAVHADQARQQPPFTQRPLGNDAAPRTRGSNPIGDLSSLLPASRRTKEDDLEAPVLSPILDPADVETDPARLAAIHDWVDEEVDLSRLSDIHNWLWIAGRMKPPRPLHAQRLLLREIVITEKLDLHLVWTTNRIFIKPLPRFLLEPHFGAIFVCHHSVSVFNRDPCSCGGRRKRALGFLFSYTALVVHESDFHIAKEMHLLPKEVEWPAWRATVGELLETPPYPRMDLRFWYGELRLSRLNKIYFFWKTPLRGYMSRWNQYGSFLYDNFAFLASATVFIAVVLTAMQVGLATEGLQDNKTFQSASYGFTIFSIVGPLAAAGLVMLVFCCLFIGNWVATRRYSRERLERIKGRQTFHAV
ncbi:ankyrin domain protein [Colletotrichum tofieldiae]|nr:ankyrin domain protein [Colletotrichum tofieldiae]